MTRVASRPTAREMETIEALFRHGSRKDAARELHIKGRALQGRLHRLYERLGVETACDAAYVLWLRDLWGDRS